MTAEKAVALAKSDAGRALLKTAAGHVAPFFFLPGTPAQGTTINNGSVFFLDCSQGAFAVTADHVYQAYLSRKEDDPGLQCRIGEVPFVPEERLIDRDPERDIATFRIEEQEVVRAGKAVYNPSPECWPPEPPHQGQGVLFAGFSGCERRLIRDQEVEFGVCAAALVATSVNDRDIVCRLARENWLETFGMDLSRERQFLGGLSGAPLWTVVERAGAVTWRLGGVISSFNEGWELLKAKHAAGILADGRLKPRLLGRI